MDPAMAISLGFTVINLVLGEINKIKAQAGLTADQLSAMADTQDLANIEAIKALIAVEPPPA